METSVTPVHFPALCNSSNWYPRYRNFSQILIYNSLGITGRMAVLFYCMYALIGTLPNFVSSYFMDRVGRHRLLLTEYTLLTFILINGMILQKQYIGTNSKAGNTASVAILWIWVGCYGFCLDPPQFVYCAEILPTTFIAKGIALGFVAYFVGAITFTTPSATAFKSLDGRCIWFILPAMS